MKRLAVLAAGWLWATGPLWAAAGAGEPHGNPTLWKALNFLVLAAGLGYLLRRAVRPYFAARTEAIRREIAEAARLREEAEARSAETDRRLANLNAEIERLRAEARREMDEEERRLKAESERAIARLQTSAELEIAALTKRARQELKAYAAELALQMAREKIRRRMSPEVAHALVEGFVHNLDRHPRRPD